MRRAARLFGRGSLDFQPWRNSPNSNEASDRPVLLDPTPPDNEETTQQILYRLLPLEQEVNKLEYYLSLLSQNEQIVLQRSFFDKKIMNEIAEEMKLSFWSVRKLRESGIQKLAEMMAFVERSDA